MSDAALQLTNVVKRYGQFTAVNDVSLSVPRGVIYGFLGPNGAGKTTTIRMVLEIIRPTSGSIQVLGKPSALLVRDRIGYLPEEKGLYKKMKAWSVIAYFASLKGLSSRDARRRAYELLERYGLKDFAEARTEALSKGMGQKVQVLASIAHDPELVILDEPFSGLDPVNQEVMEEVIRDLAKRGRTVLFSTHVMQHAERLCDRLLLISQGRKIFDGTTAEAKAHVPRKVRLECDAEAGALQGFEGVESCGPAAAGTTSDGRPTQTWELQLRDHVDPQTILQACFERGLKLRRFEQVDPTLHDVFMQLVGPEGREARFR